jgi:hypothetical protein
VAEAGLNAVSFEALKHKIMYKSRFQFSRMMRFTAFALVAFSTCAFTQIKPAVENLVPPSPEAAALGEYVTTPVGLYTGTPQVSFTLLEAGEGDLSLPISFSYHASGNRVDAIAPRTGMGWTLNAGGAIIRTIRGKADEYGVGGFLATSSESTTVVSLLSGTEQEKFNKWNRLVECGDAEPDQFSFNFSGYTGTFSFNWNDSIVVSSDQNVKIEAVNIPEQVPGGFISAFRATTETGVVYEFAAQETSDMPVFGMNQCPYNTPPVTSWYLTKVTSPLGSSVFLEYEPYSLNYRQRLAEVTSHKWGTEHAEVRPSNGVMQIEGQNLKKITTSSGNRIIEFNQSLVVRLDLPKTSLGADNTGYSLDEIVLKDRNGRKLRSFKQTYDYSTGRLTLKEIRELSEDGNEVLSKPPYRFFYTGILPSFDDEWVGFFGQDHWGYYNGASNSQLTPSYQAGQYEYEGADREPTANGSIAGMLTTIQHPTGGTTKFDFEPHDYSYIGSEEANEYIVEPTVTSVYHSSGNTAQTDQPFTRVPFVIAPNSNDPNKIIRVEYLINTYYCSPGFGGGIIGPQTAILDASGEVVRHWAHTDTEHSTQEQIGYVLLPPGEYFIEARAYNTSCYNGTSNNASMEVTWDNPTKTRKRVLMAGGVRIKKITVSDGVNTAKDIIKKYEYKILNAEGLIVSSGVISNKPKYEYKALLYEGNRTHEYISRISSSIVALGTTQGSHIGYQEVDVLSGEKGEFTRTKYNFSSFYDNNDDYYLDYTDDIYDEDYRTHRPPYAPAESYDYKRGLMQKQIEYEYSDNGKYTPVKETRYSYKYTDVTSKADVTYIYGLRVGVRCDGCRLNGGYNKAEDVFALGLYKINIGGRAKIENPNETLFNDNADFITDQRYVYDSELHFVKEQTTRTSEDGERVTIFKYPQDYPYSSGSIADELIKRNIFLPIETITKRITSNGSPAVVVDASFTEFSLIDNKVLPSKVFQFAAEGPVSDFIASDDVIAQGRPDLRYYDEGMSYDRYNSVGKVEQTTKPGNIKTSYIWGYDNTLLTAEVVNAEFSRCAYSGFESFANGSWEYSEQHVEATDGKTGKHSFRGVIKRNNLPSGDYIISMWAKGSGMVGCNGDFQSIDSEWKLYKWNVSNPTNIEINTNGNLIDDLRLHPKEATMKTFTYERGVGVTSISDENYSMVYFEYDLLGRLVNRKDQDGNILENYRYQYFED